MNKKWIKALGLIILLFPILNFAQTQNEHYLVLTMAEKNYITEITTEHPLNKKDITYLLEHAQYLPAVIEKISAPFEKKTWDFYRNYFITPDRIQKGASYWKKYQSTLQEVALKYHVDPSIIVAIIGIESLYGEKTGSFQEIGALATLAFHYPARSHFFQQELTQYFLLTQHNHLPALKLLGSYAGALGIPQFMPSSYRNYGVDFNKNNSVNLLSNHEDAIASIANYLHQAGWQQNHWVATPILRSKDIPSHWIAEDTKRLINAAQLKQYHIVPESRPHLGEKVYLVALNNPQGPQYWLASKNFLALMRYNTSVNYAMTVYQLSLAIQRAYKK